MSTVIASVFFRMSEFLDYIRHGHFKKPRKRKRELCHPHSLVEFNFQAAHKMLLCRQTEEQLYKKRIVQQKSLVMIGKRLRFRSTKSVEEFWGSTAVESEKFDCYICGEPPEPLLLNGYELERWFKGIRAANKKAFPLCQLDVTDGSSVMFRGARVIGIAIKPEGALAATQYDDFSFLICRQSPH